MGAKNLPAPRQLLNLGVVKFTKPPVLDMDILEILPIPGKWGPKGKYFLFSNSLSETLTSNHCLDLLRLCSNPTAKKTCKMSQKLHLEDSVYIACLCSASEVKTSQHPLKILSLLRLCIWTRYFLGHPP